MPITKADRVQQFLDQHDWINVGRQTMFDPAKIENELGQPWKLEENGRVLWLRIEANIISKKNALQPASRRRKGGKGLVYKDNARESMLQVQAEIMPAVRDLNLRHPDVDVYFFVTLGKEDNDRDGLWTMCLDELVRMKVFRDDSIKHFNGTVTTHPALLWKFPCAVIKITSQSEIKL